MKKIIGLFLCMLMFNQIVPLTCQVLSANENVVRITIEICRIDRSQEYVTQISKQDAIRLDFLFDDMKCRLDNANTKQETVVIFNEVVFSLNKFGLLPSHMSIEEAQQIVTSGNYDMNYLKSKEEIKTQGTDNENFNCLIVGKTSDTEFFKEGQEIIPFSRLIFIKPLVNRIISFGDEHWDWGGGSGEYFSNPASGWVWTNGSNGVKSWEGDSLWGDLGCYYYVGGWATAFWWEYWLYKGAIGFTGIRIKGLENTKFFGFASHVAINTEFPGKNQSEENPDKHITPCLYNRFIFGKVSNVRSGGYTPAYWFHIDKVMIIGNNQVPKVQWIEDCKAHMLSMNFRGFIFRGRTIIGLVSEFYIYE